jgi:hypothetical protein
MVLVSLFVVAAACGKDKAGDKAESGPKAMTAEELWAAKDSMKGKQVLVSGTVKSLYGTTTLMVLVKAGDKTVDLEFADNGEAAKAKNFKEGDPVTAECKVDGTSVDGNDLLTSKCVLK